MKIFRGPSFIAGILSAIAFSAIGFIGGGVSSSVPVGVCFDFAGTVAPSGYQIADGSALPRAGSAFFGVVGTTWGIGDGSTTYNVPDFRRRKTVGSGGSGTAVLANTVGSTGGEEAHVLSVAELAAHAHPGSSGSVTFDSTGGGGGTTTIAQITASSGEANSHGVSVSVSSQGSGTAHNVRDPSAVVLKICKL